MKLLWVLASLGFVGAAHGVHGRRLQPSSPGYWDELRQTPELEVVEPNVTNSAVYQVTIEGATYRLANIQAFLPYTTEKALRLSGGAGSDAFSIALALYHFNNYDRSPTLTEEDVGDCNVRLTMEIFDSEFSPIETTRKFTQEQRQTPSFQDPPATAVAGAWRSAVSSPLGILTGVNSIPQVSSSSTAVDFDVKEQFPLFGRLVTSTVGEARVALRFFQSLGATHVAILYITDSFGSALQKGFQDAATDAGIETKSIPFSFSTQQAGSEEAKLVIRQLVESKFRHVYAIFYEDHVEAIMGAAVEAGAVGAEYFYLFPGFDLFGFQETLTVKAGDPLLAAYNGAGFVSMQGGVTTDVVRGGLGRRKLERGQAGFAGFRESWLEATNDPDFVDYVRKILPQSLDQIEDFDRDTVAFVNDPGPGFRSFHYDAITSLGMAMCRAGEDVTFFSGPEIYDQFRNLTFHGASGDVEIIPATGTRNYTSMSFVIWNLRIVYDSEGNPSAEFSPSSVFEDDDWSSIKIPGNAFQFAGGTEIPPKSLLEVDFDFNYIGTPARIAGYTLMSVTMLSALLCLAWFAYWRKSHVVDSSQPLFLIMVCVGSFVMASTILPLSWEETIVDNVSGLDTACMAAPWLYVIGTTIAFSALFAKTKGVHQAYTNPELDFIHVTAMDVTVFFGVLLALNVVILLIWTVVSPLEWTRVLKDTKDEFNRNVESYATCDGGDTLPFVVVLAVLNLGMLVLGNIWAYQSRNIETEYSESLYIGVSMAAVLQAWTMGIPILIVVWDNPQARFYVQSGIIFVTAQAVVSFVFIPKMLALRNDLKNELTTRSAYADFLERTKKSSEARLEAAEEEAEEEDDDDEASEQSPEVEEMEKSMCINDLIDPSDDPGMSSGDILIDKLASKPQLKTQLSSSYHVQSKASESREGEKKSRSRSNSHLSASGRGLRIIHNPRASTNLRLSGGLELSKRQLDYFISSEDHGKEAAASKFDGASKSLVEVKEHDEEEESEAESSAGHPKDTEDAEENSPKSDGH